jgi:hypothetical protein
LYSLIFETYGAILFDRKKPAYTFTKQIQYLKNSGSNTGENQTNPKARLNHGSMKQKDGFCTQGTRTKETGKS